MDHHPPPIYSQGLGALDTPPQLLLVPTNSVNFQRGYLGADGERAAIEGELQIKDVEPGRCRKVIVSLRTCESAYLREIELSSSQVVLFDSGLNSSTLPSTLPFAIPLTPDTPQSIETPHSSLSHILTATLFPSNESHPPYSKSTVVHTRRYSPHTHTLFISPETFVLDDPTRVEAQIPRTTFKVGEPIPIYITVPSPSRELVVDAGLRLRNVRTELVQIIKVKRDDVDYQGAESDEDLPAAAATMTFDESADGPSAITMSTMSATSTKVPPSPLFLGSSYRTILAHSGATCRFHASREVRLRQVLHLPHSHNHPSRFQPDIPTIDYGNLESDAESTSITQTTLLHSVMFRVNIRVAFVDMSTHTERVSHMSIPITMLPPSAPLPEVAQTLDEAYQKKHDRPPARTIRYEEVDVDVPRYSENEAGPSFAGAPPPFDERDAPPPPFSSSTEASTSAHLPTFLESESEIIIPGINPDDMLNSFTQSPFISGEGLEFGFSAAEQFDGHTEDIQHSSTPPPTMEMATHDADLTGLTDMCQTDRDIEEALGLVVDRGQNVTVPEDHPPPPPAMDDPSDPPPSIDSEFRSPAQIRRASPSQPSPILVSSYRPIEPLPTPPHTSPPNDIRSPHGHAPPPYRIPDSHNEQEHVTRPPPYVD
ncbi:hypothetical protein AX15_001133 [Amanita polypyramis BW_CC]|nr:hypothetical protein AX15_001133 [Amanita polypyramis BW_CC]